MSMLAQAGGNESWQAILMMVKSVSEIMMSSLSNFWKISKAFIDGKYRKVESTSNYFVSFKR